MRENLLPGKPVFVFLTYPTKRDIVELINNLGTHRFIQRMLNGRVWICL